jgi:hypothetical protein
MTKKFLTVKEGALQILFCLLHAIVPGEDTNFFFNFPIKNLDTTTSWDTKVEPKSVPSLPI